jgi:hypothetical protein
VLAGPKLLLELLPEPDCVWTRQGLHPRVFASGARRLVPPLVQSSAGATDAAREPLVTREVLLPKLDRNPSSGPSCSTRSRTGWRPRSEPCSGRLDSTRLPRAERTAGRPTGRPPATRCPASKGRLGSPVRPSELAPWVRLRRPAEGRPPTSSEAAGGTSFRFTPDPRSATRSMG